MEGRDCGVSDGGITLVESDQSELAVVVELLSGGDAIIVGLRDNDDVGKRVVETLHAAARLADILGHRSIVVDVANAQVRPVRVIRVVQEGAAT
jgi:hypothetical protein